MKTADLPGYEWRLRQPTDHFSWDEMLKGHAKPDDLDRSITDNLRQLCLRLERVRDLLERPIVVTSGYRPPEHAAEADKPHGPGAHTYGLAADIRMRSTTECYHVVTMLGRYFKGIGIKMRGPHAGRFMHLDIWDGTIHSPRPGLWTY